MQPNTNTNLLFNFDLGRCNRTEMISICYDGETCTLYLANLTLSSNLSYHQCTMSHLTSEVSLSFCTYPVTLTELYC